LSRDTGPNIQALIKYLNSRGKYFRVSDPDGVGRLARRFSLSEKEVKEVLRVLHFVLVVRIPVRAYWSREEVLPAAREG
jgi:hypothetical protein